MKQSHLKLVLMSALFFYASFATIDILSDLKTSSSKTHLLVESILVLGAFGGFLFIGQDYLRSRNQIQQLNTKLMNLKDEALLFQKNNHTFTEGLSKAIDFQFDTWELTKSEREVALFLMKGFSLKEIGDFRKSSERTVRSQSNSIYQKSGLSGRAELTAFFLEDLLAAPKNQININIQ